MTIVGAPGPACTRRGAGARLAHDSFRHIQVDATDGSRFRTAVTKPVITTAQANSAPPLREVRASRWAATAKDHRRRRPLAR